MNCHAFSAARSLRRKLLLPLLLIGAAFAAATVWGIYAKSQKQLAERLRLRAETLANFVNYAAESVLHPGVLQRIVTALGAEEEVSFIVVVGGHPARVLATTRNAWLGQALTELPAKEVAEDLEEAIQTRQSQHRLHLETAQFDFTAPLLLSQPQLADRSLTDGAVMVHLDMRATQAAIRQLTLEFSATFLAALVILAALGYGLIHHLVLRPISRIGKLVEHHRAGAGESWAEAATHDELGALARMLHDSLKRTDAAIHELEDQKSALRESEAQYRMLVENIPQNIFIKDRDSRWVSVNENFARGLGRRPEEVVGKRDYDFFPKELAEKFRADDQRIMQTGRTEELEEKHVQDGREIWVRTVKAPVRDERGEITGVFGIFWDITERKRAQAELENVHQQLLEASRQAGMAEIATNVLHNVGNVLNSVNISTSLVVESVKKSRASSLARVVALLREHAQDLGAFITQDSRGKHVPAHLAQLAEHLLAEQATNARELDSLRRNVEHIKEIVAMQQNYATFGGVKEMVNVANLVEDSLRMNAGALSRHEVEVIREFEDVPPLNVEKHKILQILVNLLRNAKYACDDSERADKRLTVRVVNGEGRIRISVIDNGVGIPPENLTHIFNHGFTTRKDGHGFGLHSGSLAAQEMGGSLTVHSDGVGQGAAFTLELPCPAREDAHE
jgi:PAS domain S-box-containing protein